MSLFTRGGRSALSVILLGLALPVQGQGVAPSYGQLGPAEVHGPGNDLDIPHPPRGIQNTPGLPSHRLPPVPEGQPNGIPQPGSPPISGVSTAGPGAPCDVSYFVNQIVNPGGNFSQVGEPSAAFNRDTSFFTWNWGAALSQNAGVTWTYVNPYTQFSAVDGGFCCDQRTIYVPGQDMTIWYLQYLASATTNNGSIRLAIAPDRASLSANSWFSYVLNPGNFGFAPGNWLDFPDITHSDNHLYCASNVFAVSNNAYAGSVIWKMPLAQLDAGGGVNYWWWTNAGLGGSSYRFAQNGTTTQYFASHNTTSQLRAYRNADLPSDALLFWSDINVSDWSGGTLSATAPNGVDWAARADNRIASGWTNATEYGFTWHVGRRPASGRDQCYVRFVGISTTTNTYLGEQDVWNPSLAFLYPAVAVNNAGQPGYTCAFGQGDGAAGGWNPTNFYRVVDPGGCGVDFSGGVVSVPFSGDGPTSSNWGDYFTVQRSDNAPNTFIATGMARGASAQQPRYIWFGKESDTPPTPIVHVSDNLGGMNVPITVTHTDLAGLKDGTTPFARRYVETGRYELVAPASFLFAGETYLFCNWSGNALVNTTTLTVDNIGYLDDIAVANYKAERTIIVNDRNVAGAVAITVGTTDLDGLKDGSTQFTRRYKDDVAGFQFTAPATVGSQPFRRWYISNIAQPIGQQTITVTPLIGTITIEAEYCSHVHGSYATYGAGCRGSNGLTPSHTSSSHPDTGNSVTHSVSNLRGATPAVMFLGFSKTFWGPNPLPLCLGFIGANPSCCLLTEVFLQLPIAINGAGSGSLTFAVTSDPAAISVHVYTQVVAADIFLPDPLKIVVSNGLDMTIGGSSIGGQRCP